MTIPGYLPYYVVAASLAIIAALLIGLSQMLGRARWPDRERRSAVRTAAAVLLGWFAVAVVLACFGVYRAAPDRLPTIQYGISLPLLAGWLLMWRSPATRRVIDAAPQQWLIGIQVYRVLGLIFLVLYVSGDLPGPFAWPAGVGDVAVGLLAALVARADFDRPSTCFTAVSLWNVLGILDLIVAVAMGLLTVPSPLQRLAFNRPTELITVFPLVLIPTFLVPLSLLLHLASLKKVAGTIGRTHHRLGRAH